MLRVRDLNAAYGLSHVLRNVSLDVGNNETVAVLGRNGVGKTTLAHTIMGIIRPSGGSVELFGQNVAGWPAHKISRLGIALVPQGRRIFASLSVEENLRLGSAHGGSREQTWTMERVLTVFPALAARLRAQGSHLSGGEQQMLAIARALLSNPRILILDEPSEGLAPIIVQRVVEILRDLASQGISLLLVEQNLRVALELATSVCVVLKGEVAYRDSTTAFLERPDIAERLLGVGISNMAKQ